MKVLVVLIVLACVCQHLTEGRRGRGGRRRERLEERIEKGVERLCTGVKILDKLENAEESNNASYPDTSPVQRAMNRNGASEALDAGLMDILLDVCDSVDSDDHDKDDDHEDDHDKDEDDDDSMDESEAGKRDGMPKFPKINILKHRVVAGTFRLCRISKHLEMMDMGLDLPFLDLLDEACAFLKDFADRKSRPSSEATVPPSDVPPTTPVLKERFVPTTPQPEGFPESAFPSAPDIVMQMAKICQLLSKINKIGAMNLMHKYLPTNPRLFIIIKNRWLGFCRDLSGALKPKI